MARGLRRKLPPGHSLSTLSKEGEVIVSWTGTRLAGCVLVAGLVCGCGQSAPSTTSSTGAATDKQDGGLPTASISSPQAVAAPEAETEPAAPPEKGSPAWLLQEIQAIRVLPFPALASDEDDDDDADSDRGPAEKATESAEVQKQRLEQIRNLRRDRNQQVAKLATEVIFKTSKDPQQEASFLAGVHHLLDARLQLALQGDAESIDALYDAAKIFYDRDAGSLAASEAQLTLVNLAHANTLRYAKAEPRWIQEFARQAQVFAKRFPQEQERTLPLLLAAGRSCELNGLRDEALACYAQIQSEFPDSPQAQQTAAIVRRFQLKGQSLELAGPTLDGNFLALDEFRGKAVVVVFWASHAKPFTDRVKDVQAVLEKYRKYAQVISVNLDSDEAAVDQFLEQAELTWPVIFHVEPDKRGWNSPIAAHYGVTQLPTIWIVDPQGVVAETEVTADNLEAKLRETLVKHMSARGGTTSKADSPEGAAGRQ